MSDLHDDQVEFNESDAAQMAPAKKKNPPILRILAFVGIGILAVGLVATVVVVTVGAVQNQGQATQAIRQSIEFTTVPPAYATSAILAEVRTTTADPPSEMANVLVGFKLAYDEEDKAIPDELTKRRDKLNEIVLFYFQDRTARQLEDKMRVKTELLELINNNLSRPAIKEVIITSWSVIKP